MRNVKRYKFVIWVCLCFSLGCGSDGLTFAPADGVLTVDGKPFPKAIVTFLPQKGPAAIAVTDASGKFRLSSGTNPGVVVGLVTVTVTAPQPEGENQLANSPELARQPKTPAEAAAYLKKANELQAVQIAKKRAESKKSSPSQSHSQVQPSSQSKPKSPIDLKYSKSESSGLSYTIKANGDNHFLIQL